MKALVPNTIRTANTLSVDAVNQNRQRRAAEIRSVIAKRYMSHKVRFDFDGITDGSAQVLREFTYRPQYGVQVVAVELVLFSAAAATVTWSLASAVSGWETVTLACPAGATAEARGVASFVANLPAATVATFTLSCSGTSTVTRGYFVLHLRADRYVGTGWTLLEYTPTLLSSADTDSATPMNTEFTAEAAAVASDALVAQSLRSSVYLARGYSNATAANRLKWRIPSTGRTMVSIEAYVVAAVGVTATWTLVDAAAATVGARAVAGGGVAVRVASSILGVGSTQTDDPLTAASDYILTLAITGGTALLTYFVVHYS